MATIDEILSKNNCNYFLKSHQLNYIDDDPISGDCLINNDWADEESDDDESSTNSSSSTPTPTSTNGSGPVTMPIGAYHPVDGGPPQLGYFVPLGPMCLLSPQIGRVRKRDTIDSQRSHRSTSYCDSTNTPTPIPSSQRSSIAINSTPSHTPLQLTPQLTPQHFRQSSSSSTTNNNNNHHNNNNNTINGYGSSSTHNYSSSSPSTASNGLGALSKKNDKKSGKSLSSASQRYSTPVLGFEGILSMDRRPKKNKLFNRAFHSMNETIEVLADPVFEDDALGERTSWEYHTVTVTRVPGYGFGIAVSGGRDNPHFANGDPSIAVSDVLKGGPAEDRLQVNDRIISVNGVSLENVEYATAVQVLRDSGNTVTLVIKRRVPNLNMISTPNHQHSHSLSSTGLGVGGATTPQQTIKLVLSKSNKKDDFGIVLGCRLFIKEISSKARDQLAANGYTLQEGDTVTRIHNTNCNDAMSLKEAKKIIDGCKEKLNLVVIRDAPPPATSSGGASYSAQNLYVQPPTRPAVSTLLDDKSNLTPRGGGRSRNPLMDVSLSQLDRPSTPNQGAGAGALPGSHSRTRSGLDEPPRPPPPRGEDFYSSRRQLYEDDPLQRSKQSAEPRFISFQKEGSVGIRLTGGNEAGIFVTAVQPGSPASLQGLTPGDKILKVNDMDMNGVTREEAVLFLLSLQDRIDLIVQHCKEEYDNVVANQRGDSFHIKTHFHYENPSKGEMSFKAGDVFRVIDTLHNGVVGSWQVLRISRGHQEMQRGVIPNKSRAEELATAQFNATKKEMNASESRGNFFRRRRSSHRRSKSLSRENWDDVVFSDSISKFPAYERVVLRHPGFVRPVVLFGPTADLARDRLIKDFPDKFTMPLQDDGNKGASKSGIVRLSNIRDIMDRGKHALLDITPNAVDRLNYAQFYPIVIFLKADSKHIIKQLRHGIPKSAHKSSKKLFEQCQKLDRVWSHVFSTVIGLNDGETWYRKLRESIDQQQSGAVWMSETKPVESLSDDFLFPMTTSRLSYASSPESDLELSPGPSASLSLGNLPQLVKSSSDPSIATNQDNLDRDRELNIGDGMPPPYTNPYDHGGTHGARRSTVENKYGFAGANGTTAEATYGSTSRQSAGAALQALYGTAPDLPPRVDRASKPPGLNTTPTQTLNPNQRHSNPTVPGGTIMRSAQERLFSAKLSSDNVDQDEYGTTRRSNGNSMERNQSSLDRQRAAVVKNSNGSYDSVSSYDSYNTTQLSVQNIRLGPNAPDDLKSVPNANDRTPPTPNAAGDPTLRGPNAGGHQHSDSMITNRSSMHEHSRSLSGGPNDLNRQNSPGRPPYPGDRNIGMISPHGGHPQRPTNLGLESSPRKHVLETKTDYGKYSRNNSATQADYKTPPPTTKSTIGPPPSGPFKPVPPPKPKNYRPPIQGGNGQGNGNWDNGEPTSPRSPNGFYYPPAQSHYHHNTPSSPNAGHHGGAPPPMHPYNQQYSGGSGGNYGTSQMPPYAGREPPIGNNGYNGSHPYGGGQQQYMHRNPGMNNLPHHPSERHALDLAGSREQRGSAFELYRKPQIGVVGHHHNMSIMDHHPSSSSQSSSRYHDHNHPANYHHHPPPPRPHSSSSSATNEMNERKQYACDQIPPLPPPKSKNYKLLKSPLKAIRNALIKTTRPLRRQSSMVDPTTSSASRPSSILRRQSSMLEQRHVVRMQSPEYFRRHQQYNDDYHYSMRHEPFQPSRGDDMSTYRNLESESIYGYAGSQRGGRAGDYYDPEQENLYANRALIDLERQNVQSQPRYGGRIIRRHSLADRPATHRPGMTRRPHEEEDQSIIEPIYQTRGGSYMMDDRTRHEDYLAYQNQNRMTQNVYQNRRDMHRDHLYQSRSEMQERINLGRREVVNRAATDSPVYSTRSSVEREQERESTRRIMTEDPAYQSRREIKEYRPRSQLRDQIYQTRRETLESMAEPTYVSKRELKHEPIYEAKESCNDDSIDASSSPKKIDLNLRPEPSGQEAEQIENDKVQVALAQMEDMHLDDNEKIDDELTLTGNSETLKTVIENEDNNADEANEIPMTPRSVRSPYHISNVIKRTAPPSGEIYASRTSVETQYTSQGSLPVGPPNAQSTPYASDLSIGLDGVGGATAGGITLPPREPTTTRGIFTDAGGTLSDPVWKVSLIIPPGSIPSGVDQEIYFTVTDPRLSEHVGGPPLDMENGETMLSPLVMCGPQGLEFLVPVTLNIPHCAARTLSLGISLKATDSEKNLRTDWDNIELPSNTAAHTVSVKVDHF